jgi:adenosylcobinamide-GDP ribazoletransferase
VAGVVVTALGGALGALSRLPIGRSEKAWDAFRRAPLTFPLAGYVIGALVAAPLLLTGAPVTAITGIGVPIPTAAVLYLAIVYLVTGISHADGLADVADGAAIHGTADDRLRVMADSQTGAAGTLAVSLAVVTLGLGAFSLAGAGPALSFAVALCAEVSAKTGMATLVCFGSSAHEGLGSQLVSSSDWRSFVPVLSAAAPVLLLAPISGGPALLAALLAGPAVAVVLLFWSAQRLGGVSGDVLGATNELGRVVSIHAGVVAWTLF